jgi:hypothetical protein
MKSRSPFRTPYLATLSLGALLLGAHCTVHQAPAGVRATPPGSGPLITFDVFHQPLPEIPQPNDVATFPDPTSRTGRRINVSTIAATEMETLARVGFGEMEGWGTFAPITLAFSKEPGQDPSKPALDLNDIRARMQHDGHDMTNDPVYIINLTTGVPVMVDMGDGNFSYVPNDPTLYWPNDIKESQNNILFETVEEGPGLSQENYSPQLDLDFDGVLDHPDVLGPLPAGGIEGIDDLTPWYEQESDTLIVRPLLPMDEKTEYAVVITDRLHGPDGQPVRSPFAYVNHPEQTADVQKAVAVLSDSSRANYYGDIAGTGAAHIAFAWTFTTEPTYEDLRLLRDGLYERGPFAALGKQFPPKAEAFKSIGLAGNPADEQIPLPSNPACVPVLGQPYVVSVPNSQGLIDQLVTIALKNDFSLTTGQQQILIDSFNYVDHVVIGTFQTPYLLSTDPTHEDPSEWFHVNFQTGQARVTSDTVPFMLFVPKATAQYQQPFPTVVWSHGLSTFKEEAVLRGGYFGRQGMATLAIDLPGHGLYLDESTQDVAGILLRAYCYGEWINGLTASRAYDLNGDGVPDSGGYNFTAHVFHTRDAARQGVIDQMQASRLVRSFDGKSLSDQDYNADGKLNDLAGDFDGNGTPDIGGSAPIYAAGDSYGGIVTMILGAVDPNVVVAAPISGGGGLTDAGAHTSLTLITNSVNEQILSPMIIGVPATARGSTAALPSSCQSNQTSIRFEVNDLFDSRELEIACLNPTDLAQGMTFVARNQRNGVIKCTRVGANGNLRMTLPSDVGDGVILQVFKQTDAVKSYATCELKDGAIANLGQQITTWQVGASTFTPVTNGASCGNSSGCQQFRDTFYPVGTALTVPQEGIGYARQTPDLRRLFDLSQGALDTADPITFAPYYMLKPIIGINGETLPRRGIMVQSTVGDPDVPIATGTAFARAAGVVPFLPPAAATTMPEYANYATPPALYAAAGGVPNDIMIANYVVEGIPRLERTHAGPACNVNFNANAPAEFQCGSTLAVDPSTCAQTLYDIDWHSEGTNLEDAPHPVAPSVPLRLGRLTSVQATDPNSLVRAWAPRLNVLAPNSPDSTAASAPVIALVNCYVNPLGQHVYFINDPCRAFDDVTYYDTQMARYLATGGTDLYSLSHPQTHKCMATQTCPFDGPGGD